MVLLWYYNGIIIGGTKEKHRMRNNLKSIEKSPSLSAKDKASKS